MTIDQAYLEFLQLVGRNATNNNVNVDKPRFILLYNSTKTRFLEWVLEKKNEDIIRYVAPLLVSNVQLSKVSDTEDYQAFALPTDFFDHSNLAAYATTGCGSSRLLTWEIKNDDVEELYHSPSHEPSAEWEETFYHLSSGNILVYRKGFDIDKTVLTYYRNPVEVDIGGYIKSDKTNSSDVHPELQDKAVRRILLGMSKAFSANNNDPNAYQIAKDQLFSII